MRGARPTARKKEILKRSQASQGERKKEEKEGEHAIQSIQKCGQGKKKKKEIEKLSREIEKKTKEKFFFFGVCFVSVICFVSINDCIIGFR